MICNKHRLEAEQRRLEEIGLIAYYSEWVEAYKQKDTSWEAIQKHFEETGEDENTQLITMFQHQTAGEYRIMMGTDVRIQRDRSSTVIVQSYFLFSFTHSILERKF